MATLITSFFNLMDLFNVAAWSIHPNKRYIAFGLDDGSIYLAKIFSKAVGCPVQVIWIGIGHQSTISFLGPWISSSSCRWEFVKIKGSIISADIKGELSCWDISDGRCLLANKNALDGAIRNCLVDKSETYLVCSGDSCYISVISLDNLNILHKFNFLDDWFNSSVFFHTGEGRICAVHMLFSDQFFYAITKKYGLLRCRWNLPSLLLVDDYSGVFEKIKSPLQNYCQLYEIKPNLFDSNWLLFFSAKLISLTFQFEEFANVPINVNCATNSIWKDCCFLSESLFACWNQEAYIYIFKYQRKDSVIGISLFRKFSFELSPKDRPFTIVPLYPSAHLTSSEGSSSPFLLCLSHEIGKRSIRWMTRSLTNVNLSENEKNAMTAQWNVFSPSLMTIHSSPLTSLSFTYPDHIILGFKDGGLFSILFHKLIKYEQSHHLSENLTRYFGHDSSVVSILFPLRDFTNMFLSGGLNGELIVWSFQIGQPLAKFLNHNSSIVDIFQYARSGEGNKPFSDKVICLASDSTISIISLEKLECLSILAPRKSYPVGFYWKFPEDVLLIEYMDKSIDILMNFKVIKTVTGECGESLISDLADSQSISTSKYEGNHHRKILSLSIELKKILLDEKHPNLSRSLALSFLSLFHFWGFYSNPDKNLKHLGLRESSHPLACPGAHDHYSILLKNESSGKNSFLDPSPNLSAERLLVICSLILYLKKKINMDSMYEFYFRGGLRSLYSTAVSGIANRPFPSLQYWASKWGEITKVIAGAAQFLFKEFYSLLSNEDRHEFINYWKRFVFYETSETTPVQLQRIHSPLSKMHSATFIIGICGVIQPELLDLSLRKAIAENLIKISRDNIQNPSALTATQILCKGIIAWHHHIRMEDIWSILHALMLSKNVHIMKLAKSLFLRIFANIGPSCVIHFCKECLSNKNITFAKSSMLILSCTVPKIPVLFHPYLPLILDSAILLMDPSVPDCREKLQPYFSSTLDTLLKIYANMDYHESTKKLALSQDKGSILIYDMKTATKWQVLEGHRRCSTSLRFSGSGLLLASYSEFECTVCVWKIASGSMTFFLGSGVKCIRVFHVSPRFYNSEIPAVATTFQSESVTDDDDDSDENQPEQQGLVTINPKIYKEVTITWRSEDIFDLHNLKSGDSVEFNLGTSLNVHEI